MNNEQAQSAQANDGRNENGQFTTGNKGGPGNPFVRKVAALRRALIASVTEKDIQDVAERLLALAKEGNVPAAKLLLSYTLGKPEPAPQPDRVDADEWEVHKETAGMKNEVTTLMTAATPEFYLNTVRAIRPAMSFVNQNEVEKIFSETPEQLKARQTADAESLLNSLAPNWKDLAGKKQPSPNGKKRPPAKGNDGFQPSTNGDSPHE